MSLHCQQCKAETASDAAVRCDVCGGGGFCSLDCKLLYTEAGSHDAECKKNQFKSFMSHIATYMCTNLDITRYLTLVYFAGLERNGYDLNAARPEDRRRHERYRGAVVVTIDPTESALALREERDMEADERASVIARLVMEREKTPKELQEYDKKIQRLPGNVYGLSAERLLQEAQINFVEEQSLGDVQGVVMGLEPGDPANPVLNMNATIRLIRNLEETKPESMQSGYVVLLNAVGSDVMIPFDVALK